MVKKKIILQLKNIYTAAAFKLGNEQYIAAGSETEPLVFLHHLESGITEQVENCPGGMMALHAFPGNKALLVSIMGLYPPFAGKDAGIYLHQKTSSGWGSRKMTDLSFAHRFELINVSGRDYLVAATVSKDKKEPEDWSLPGEVHVISIDDFTSKSWESQLIYTGITRNHGMCAVNINGSRKICVSGSEGIFVIQPGPDFGWSVNRFFDREVSEMAFIDLDGDGKDEMITIEPFHGSALCFYKLAENGWQLKYLTGLSFGHGLSCGIYHGLPVIIAGNRQGRCNLEAYVPEDLNKGIVKKYVIEEHAASTQTQVFHHGSKSYILSANQGMNQVSLYSGSLE